MSDCIWRSLVLAVIYNSVDTEQFFCATSQEERRSRRSAFYIRLMYFKCFSDGLAVILEKVRQAIPESSGSHVWCAVSSKSKELSIPDYAEFSYAIRHNISIKDIYSQCDVWLCASVAEGFHLPPLEAMACRCPVVSTRVGGPADIIDHGKNGFLAEVHDIDTLTAHTIDVLSMSADRWHAMSQAAYETATGYTWDDAASRFEKALLAAVDQT